MQPPITLGLREERDRLAMSFAEVAVDTPVGHDRTFTYSIPPSLDPRIGQLVRVPFGPRKLQGVVFSLSIDPQVGETRDILGISGNGPVLSDIQLRLARWVSSYYMCSLFDAVALMLPPGGRVRQRTYLVLGNAPTAPELSSLTEPEREMLAYLGRNKRVGEDRLLRAVGRGAKAALRRLEASGHVVRSHRQQGSSVGPKLREYAKLSPEAAAELPDRLKDLKRRAPRQAAVLSRLMKNETPIALAEARKEYGRTAINALLDKGWLQKESAAIDRDPLAGFSFPQAAPVTLTANQKTAGAEVRAALLDLSHTPRTFLMEGVTGSGKTEVYLAAVESCLQLRKKAIVLVPEIALTHQTIERFARRFPGQVAVLHSGLSAGERFDQWWKVQWGGCGVVIGSRSAIFAPQKDLGLIVIDEEHEWTYKQHDASPRYHTRDVAARLAELTSSVLVLGSASPDVGSYHEALGGRSRLLRLPARFFENGDRSTRTAADGGLASVEVVDMRRELREGHRRVFSRSLLREMGRCLENGFQAILFLNRRGSASYMQCRQCGFGLRCRRCDISMVYHRDVDRLRCHYCGDRRIPPPRCPQCRGFRMAYSGMGTKAVVAELSKLYPKEKILRWDRDSAGSPAAHEKLLEQFRSREARVLVGTQMIAKGLHFPSVTLVGVVSADVGLSVPDFRAGERAFQLLSQVAGRSGRGTSEGRVIVQTFQPENYAIKHAAAQDYRHFYDQEIAYRGEQGNPPFSHLIRLLYAHTNSALCEREAKRLSGLLREERDSWGLSDIEILGPTPAHPARLRGHYRWQLVLRGPDPRILLDKATVPQGWVIDVDPVGTA